VSRNADRLVGREVDLETVGGELASGSGDPGVEDQPVEAVPVSRDAVSERFHVAHDRQIRGHDLDLGFGHGAPDPRDGGLPTLGGTGDGEDSCSLRR